MDLETQSDESLMEFILQGNHQAFSELVRRHTDRYYRLAFRVVSRGQDAEDVVQDAFIKLWARRAKWDPKRGAKFTTWFYRVVYNQALDHLRKNRKTPESGVDYLDTFADDRHSQEAALQMSEEQRVIETAINTLPERQKTALNLCFYEGVSNKEAAKIMDVGVKALESLLMRAKKSLKATLVDGDDTTRGSKEKIGEKKYA